MKNIQVAAVVATVALLASAVVQAQVYKCQEGGRTVITDRPCVGGETMKVKPASGSFDPKKRAEVYERIDRQAKQVEDGYRMIEDQQVRERPRPGAPAEPDKCDRLRAEHAQAKYWEGEFRHPENVARERAKRKKAVSDSFFECGLGRRVPVFDE